MIFPSARSLSLLFAALSYLATQPTRRQTDLSDLVDPTNRVLVFWQISGTGVSGLHGRRALEDRRQASSTDVEFAELIVGNLDRISGIAVTLCKNGASLVGSIHTSALGFHMVQMATTNRADDLAIGRLHVNQSSSENRGSGVISCLCKDSHGRTQRELDMSGLQVALSEVGRKLQISHGVVRFLCRKSLSFGFKAQTNNVFLGQGHDVLDL